MATSFQPKRYLLRRFDAAFNSRHVECLPATVPVCSFCRALPSEHYTLSCEHVYCGACFEDVVKTRPFSLRCPIDDKSMRNRKGRTEENHRLDGVNRLLVFCWNRQRGCPYTGVLADMPGHFKRCAFNEVVCSLGSDVMLRLNLAAHFRAAHEKRGRSTRQHPATGDDPIPAADTRSTQPPPARESSEGSTASTCDDESDDADPNRCRCRYDGFAVNVCPA
ncbi:hypothetical protein HPB48_006190 [Haemaphysalis longicornis]|uniref:RING-type domain-containing protein n=1 Tax=Haemaphysalis longicornis TaxID=44386 RepID=A0A9J6FVH7_HAELO|nr:hypothetical protein HPB48_006190 [Haemaphysalis longicornis]